MSIIQNKQDIEIIQKNQKKIYKIQEIFNSVKILTYSELYKLWLNKKSFIVLGTEEYDKIEYSKPNIEKSIHKIKIVDVEERSSFTGLFFKIDTQSDDFLWTQRLYPNEKIRGQINGNLYKYLYYFIRPNKKEKYQLIDKNKLDLLPISKKKSEIKRLETIYQKPYFKQTIRYDLYKKLQKKSTKNLGNKKRILIICGLEEYIKKETTQWINKLFPDNKLEIINTGETGQYYFMLGESEWPHEIKGKFDLIVFEYCPKNIFYYNNFVFINDKLKKNGYILFLPVTERYGFYNKIEFQNFIKKTLINGKILQ